jgi:hypothetical protein
MPHGPTSSSSPSRRAVLRLGGSARAAAGPFVFTPARAQGFKEWYQAYQAQDLLTRTEG